MSDENIDLNSKQKKIMKLVVSKIDELEGENAIIKIGTTYEINENGLVA